MRSLPHIRRDIIISMMLIVATIVTYWQVGNHQFISLDDGLYIFENPKIRAGMSVEGIAWAFGFTGIAYWHPLTWISHMLDCQLFGLNAGRHHMMNLIFHLTNSLILFYLFRKITGDSWKSGVIATLFAVHPINVESVAWIAERKNVLSTFFWMLTLMSYSFYSVKRRLITYTLTLLLFGLGLLAKPAIVTLPFVMLLLDFWPLNRLRTIPLKSDARRMTLADIKTWLQKSNISGLILEKIPFFFLTTVSIYISYMSTQHHDIVVSTHEVPHHLRLANGLVSYMNYLGKMFWPQKLAVFYPYPNEIPIWMTTLALIWVICVSVIVLRWALRLPYLAVGWFWYLGTLVPHIGLMQAGLWPALADRWAYIPFIGLFIMLAWGVPRLFAERRYARFALPIVTVMFISSLTLMTWKQIGYWKNNFALYHRAIDVTRNNHIAHNNLGAAYFDAAKNDRAIYHFVEALKIQPGYAPSHKNLNRAIGADTKSGDAIGSMHKLLEMYPDNAALHYNLGNLYKDSGQLNKAIFQYQTALVHQPDFVHAINNQAAIYIAKADYSKAITLLKQIAALQPDDPGIYVDLARVYALQRQTMETIKWLERAIQKGFDDLELLQTDRQLKLLIGTMDYQEFLLTLQKN